MRLAELRASATAAHVGPLVVFTLLNAVPDWFKIENSALPWHVQAPEIWWYPVQTLICAGLLIWWRQHYTLRPWRGLALAAGLAALGIAVWVLPAVLQQCFPGHPAWAEKFGVMERLKGFDPTVVANPEGYALTVFLRFARSVLVVPFVEELCWRGWLMRYVVAKGRPFQSVAFGAHRWPTFWIVTTAVMLVHQPVDYLPAFIWGALVYFLAVRTKSLGACVVMHAVGNLLLGVYVMRTGQWGFW
ncbi:MAG: CAAX prenyl protease-related protein [Verrucomicrobiaceae bacterium]|nr:CAAX prenyl protease-related protein [Verrucomicrobiaceae bacterium]